ncbi:MAG: Secretion system C-terminal sorting domain [Bacteroidota bacterium]|jgi:hypothetical protein
MDKPFYLEAILTGGNPTATFTFSWAHSTDGFNYTSLTNTNQSIGFLAPNVPYQKLYFRVIMTATSATGTETVVAFHTVQTLPKPSNTDLIIANPSNSNVNEANNLIIYPIPVNDNLVIYFYNTDVEMVNMAVTDITGKLVYYTNNIHSFAGSNQSNISTSALPDGIYFLQMLGTSKFKASKSFVVHH